MAGRKTGIRDEVAILNSRGQVWAGWRVDKVSEGRGAGIFALTRSYPGARASKIQDGARLANGGFSAMKPPVTACKQATSVKITIRVINIISSLLSK